MASSFILAPQPIYIWTDRAGKPLANGFIKTYSNLTRDPKAVFLDAAGEVPAPQPIPFSANGMLDYPIYWENNGIDWYYVEVYAEGESQPINTVDNFPASVGGGGGGTIEDLFISDNYSPNIDFKFNYGSFSTVPQGDTEIAPGGWIFRKLDNFAVDSINFNRFPLGTADPEFNPEYEFVYNASSFSGSETGKYILQKKSNVKSFSGESITLDFFIKGSVPVTAEIVIIQNFGTGGSPSTDVVTLFPIAIPVTNYGRITQTITVPLVTTKSLGTNGDDYIAIGISMPLTTIGTISVTSFSIVRGALIPPIGFFDTSEQTYYKCIKDLIPSMIQQYLDENYGFLKQTGFIIQQFVNYGVVNSDVAKYAIPGFLGMEDQTVGNASSGADESKDIYKNLFIYLWMSIPDSLCPVSGGRGASALSDWNAGKFIRLPLTKGRVIGNYGGDGASIFYKPLGYAYGSETISLSVDNMPPHSHNVPLKTGNALISLGNNMISVAGQDYNLSTSVVGSGTPFSIAQPSSFLMYYIKY